MIIKPIKFEEVDHHGKSEEPERSGNKPKKRKLKLPEESLSEKAWAI